MLELLTRWEMSPNTHIGKDQRGDVRHRTGGDAALGQEQDLCSPHRSGVHVVQEGATLADDDIARPTVTVDVRESERVPVRYRSSAQYCLDRTSHAPMRCR